MGNFQSLLNLDQNRGEGAVIDGSAIAATIRSEIAAEVAAMKGKHGMAC